MTPAEELETRDPSLCACGHRHATTRGPCTRWDVCGCRRHRPNLDPPEQIARRRRELLEAVDDCPHNLHKLARLERSGAA